MIEQLWKEYNDSKDTKVRDQLIIACLPYVKSTAQRLSIYSNSAQDTDDLVNAGIIGLMDAIDRYDPSKGASLKSYAQHRIRGSIMDEIRSMDWVPYSTRDKAKRIGKTYAELENNGNKDPIEQDIAKAMAMTLDQYYDALLEISRMTISLLDDIFHDDDEITSDDNNMGDPEKELLITETEALVGEAIEKLPDKERLVISLYYYEEMTMKDIGKTINVSESRVCQLHSSAVLRLHAKLKLAGMEVTV
ncbi:MAG: FliA/WhiG family RNA polymerase sigma factor [Candidatus Poribacteria bacterium]